MIDVLDLGRQVRWDAPYRLLASLAALVAALGLTPLEAARGVTAWAGVDVARQLAAAERWMAEPSRADVLAVLCVLFAAVSLLSMWGYARSGVLPNAETRAGATLMLSYAIAVQIGYWPSWLLLALLLTVPVLGIAADCLDRPGIRFYAVWWDSFLAWIWAPAMLLGWATMLSVKESAGRRSADNPDPSTDPAPRSEASAARPLRRRPRAGTA